MCSEMRVPAQLLQGKNRQQQFSEQEEVVGEGRWDCFCKERKVSSSSQSRTRWWEREGGTFTFFFPLRCFKILQKNWTEFFFCQPNILCLPVL